MIAILLASWIALPATAATRNNVWDFTPHECQEYLKSEVSFDATKDAQAEHILAWMTASHPVVRAMFESPLPIGVKFDLFFLTSGYVLPPVPPRLFSHRQSLERYDRRISFYSSNWMFDTRARGRKALYQALHDALNVDQNPSHLTRRLNLVTDLVGKSVYALALLTKPESQIQLTHDGKRAINISTGYESHWIEDMRSRLEISWPLGISGEHLRQLAELVKYLENDDVRARVVRRVSHNLADIVRVQQEYCTQLNTCDTSDAFASTMTLQPATALDSPKVITEELETADQASLVEPPIFFAKSLRDFLRDDIRYEASTLEDAPLDDVWSDIQRVTDYTSEALFELQPWWADRAGWRQLLARLEPTIESVESLRRRVSSRRMNIRRALEGFTRAEDSFEKLDAWMTRTNAYVASLDATEVKVAALTFDRRERFASILSGAPLLAKLVETSRTAISQRRQIMNHQLEAIQNVNILLGLVAHSRVKEPSRSSAVDDLPAYLNLREVLGRLTGED